ncbi:MAG: SprB repeat-containing protein [Bacteroidetes bacterium]|nr:SprB repeat-containing protein [Bacteroidota bacterium]
MLTIQIPIELVGHDNHPSIELEPWPAAFTISVFTSNFNGFNVSCNGGNNGGINISIIGGVAPYTYIWSNGQTTEDIFGLAAGIYKLQVTDFTGFVDSVTVNMTQPPILGVIITTFSNPSCNGFSNGKIEVFGNGGVGSYSYVWSTGDFTPSITSKPAGTYTVTITDANGCTIDSSITLIDPPLLSVVIDSVKNVACFGANTGIIYSSAIGGVGNISFLWNNGKTTSSIANLLATSYTVTVTDFTGCSASASSAITQPSALVITSILSKTFLVSERITD